jgi:hypothetical protein
LNPAYKWLGFHCGYNPQIWLSRGCSSITGFRTNNVTKGFYAKTMPKKKRKININSVLFHFDVLPKTYTPVDYSVWCYLLTTLSNTPIGAPKEVFDRAIVKLLEESFADDKIYRYEFKRDDSDPTDYVLGWERCGKDLDVYLNKFLFVERDQVVVPSLNLKSAKKILCRNEKQKKTLRKMGFIEDRIVIKNVKRYSF